MRTVSGCASPIRICVRQSVIAIDYADAAELADKSAKALKALQGQPTRNLEGAATARHLPWT